VPPRSIQNRQPPGPPSEPDGAMAVVGVDGRAGLDHRPGTGGPAVPGGKTSPFTYSRKGPAQSRSTSYKLVVLGDEICRLRCSLPQLLLCIRKRSYSPLCRRYNTTYAESNSCSFAQGRPAIGASNSDPSHARLLPTELDIFRQRVVFSHPFFD